MTSDKAGARDGGAEAAKNEVGEDHEYKVTAKDGVTIGGHGYLEKGKVVKLDRDASRALLAEGSIKEA